MKNYRRKGGLILGFLTLLAFTLASCQKEEITEHSLQTKVQPKFKIVKITNNEITENKDITEKLNFFTETLKERKQNKTVYSSEHDFYINTDFATYIEKPNGAHSYTFAVQYAEETGEINNLVLHSKEGGGYDAVYLSYDVTENEKALINQGASVNLEGKVSYAFINDDNFIDSLFSKVTTYDECLVADYTLGPCNAGYSYEHSPEPFSGYSGGMCSGSTQTLVMVSYDMDCIDNVDSNTTGDGYSNAGDTTGTNGNPNNPNPNGGGSNTSDNDPITTPITCEGCPPLEDEEEEDCPPTPPQVLNQLEVAFGVGNAVLECDTPKEDAQFDSIEELQEYFNNIEQTSTEGETTILQQNTVKDDRYFILQTLPAVVKLKCVTKYELPNNEAGINLLSVSTSIIGNESISEWTSDDNPTSPTYTVNEEFDFLRIQVSGNLKTGLYVPIMDKVYGITKSYNVVLQYKYSTGEFIEAYVTAVN